MSTSSTSELEPPDLPETPDTNGAYPRLTDEHILLLWRYGDRRRLTKGSTLFCEGDRDCGLFVVLDGRVVAIWRLAHTAKAASVTVAPLERLSPATLRAVEAEVSDIARFLGRPVGTDVLDVLDGVG